VRSPRSEYENNVVTLCARERCTDGAGLTEFEALGALPPFDDSGNIAWAFEGEPTTRRENVGSNYTPKGMLSCLDVRAQKLRGSGINPQHGHSA